MLERQTLAARSTTSSPACPGDAWAPRAGCVHGWPGQARPCSQGSVRPIGWQGCRKRQLRGSERVGWNFGDILDAVSPVIPADAPAFIHGERTITWGEATQQTNNLARGLIARG